MKKLGCLVVFAIIAFFAYVSNPSEEDHVEYTYALLKEQGIDNLGINPDYLVIGEGLLGKDNMSGFLKKFISRKNYLLFSLTEVHFRDTPQTVAIGAFGKIWSISDLDFNFDFDFSKLGIK